MNSFNGIYHTMLLYFTKFKLINTHQELKKCFCNLTFIRRVNCTSLISHKAHTKIYTYVCTVVTLIIHILVVTSILSSSKALD